MTLHLVKLSVGSSSIEDHVQWQRTHRRFKTSTPGKLRVFHTTFQTPKRQAELLDGGSLYWVIKGLIMCRQRLVGFEDGAKEDGSPCCLLLLDQDMVPVRPTPRKAFQGWRYLDAADAPPDLSAGKGDAVAGLPAAMRKELASLGLL